MLPVPHPALFRAHTLTLTHLATSQVGGTNCPACRGVSSSVTPSRVLQVMIDVLLRADPSRARTDREKQQADEVYKSGQSFRVRILPLSYTSVSFPFYLSRHPYLHSIYL